jgi:APA family basic amino acid/polyamine antiporter
MLFVRKPLSDLLQEAHVGGEHSLKKSLGTWGLVTLGIGAIIGAGLFSITGMAAANYAGPGIVISFVIAALGCALAGLCYAEFASMIPVAGSAYTYSYATMGEFIAWIIGWDLVLEYAVGSATVASSWSGYLKALFDVFGVSLPAELMMTPFDTAMVGGQLVHGIVNLPAVFIIIITSLLLIKGTSESAVFNAVIVVLKVSIVLIFIFVGIKYVRPENHIPFVPQNTGSFGSFGWSGVIRAAAVVFFAYVGFDAVSTAAQETKNPKKSMPIGILGSLLICTVLYVAFAYVMTGVVKYTAFNSGDAGSHLAPVAIAIKNMGQMGANGVVVPAYPWLNTSIIVAILLGYSSVILVLLLGQSRVFYSMSKDGLLPKSFSQVHPKFKTPYKSNLFFLVLVSVFAAFVPGRVVGEMTSIGTLFAFILVCIGVIVLRKTMPEAPRAFRTPLVPYVPVLGIIVCFFMMVFLPFDTWIRLIVWMIVGLDIYLLYSVRHSHLTSHQADTVPQANKLVGLVGIILSFVLIGIALIHHYYLNAQDLPLLYFSLVFALVHLLFFIYKKFIVGTK